LNLFGRSIEPDVYGITDENVVFMAEGKLTYEGKALDEAITQGNSYQRFAHYVYVFFPSYVFKEPDVKDHAKDLCIRNNLGLLLMPENGNIEDIEEIVKPRLSKFFVDEKVWNRTVHNIKKARESIVKLLLLSEEAKGIGIVHLAMLRDICYLLEGEWERESFIDFLYREKCLLKEYRDKGKNSTLGLYDWSYKKPLLEGLKGERNVEQKAEPEEIEKKFAKIVDEAIKTLVYLGLCQIKNEKIKLTGLGVHFKNVIERRGKNELFSRNTTQINDLFVSILLSNPDISEYVMKLCEEIAQGDPQPNYLFWCSKCGVEKQSWELKKKEEWEKIRNIYESNEFCCFKCKNKKVPLTRAIYLPLKGLDLNYRLNILLEEAKVLDKKRFTQLPKKQQEKLEEKNLKPPKNTVYWILGENAPLLKSTRSLLTE
jgi:hypothetical protein